MVENRSSFLRDRIASLPEAVTVGSGIVYAGIQEHQEKGTCPRSVQLIIEGAHVRVITPSEGNQYSYAQVAWRAIDEVEIESGVRTPEEDVKSGEPVILHGERLTTTGGLRDTLTASFFPLIDLLPGQKQEV